jgi:predicted peptidase
MKRFCVFVCLIVVIASIASGQEGSERKVTSVVESFESRLIRPVRIQYAIQFPSQYEVTPAKRWPLVVYLHGGPDRGSDIARVKRDGPPLAVEKGTDFPFVLVSPQCPKGEIWTDTEGLMALINSVAEKYRIDSQRVYLTGMSMGGRGVLYLASKYPSRFAAVAALAPYLPEPSWAKAIATTPVLIVQGDSDPIAPISDTKDLVEAIRQAKGDVELTILPGRNHFISDFYAKDDLYAWLLKHQHPTSN